MWVKDAFRAHPTSVISSGISGTLDSKTGAGLLHDPLMARHAMRVSGMFVTRVVVGAWKPALQGIVWGPPGLTQDFNMFHAHPTYGGHCCNGT